MNAFFRLLFGGMIALALCASAIAAPATHRPKPAQLEATYHQAWQKVNDTYFDKDRLVGFQSWKHRFDGKLSSLKDLQAAIKAMTASLDDKWTSFTSDSEKLAQQRLFQSGFRYPGLWVKESKESPGKFYVELILQGFPAYSSSLRIGDEIVAINGKPLKGMKLEAVEALLGGKVNDKLLLSTMTPMGVASDVSLTIQSPSFPDSDARIIEDAATGKRFLQLSLYAFNRGTIDDLEEKIKALAVKGMGKIDGILLDMRGNSGGFVVAVVRVGSLLLADGKVLRQVSRDGDQVTIWEPEVIHPDESEQTLDAATRKMLTEAPLVVLINGTTRSAPETLTGGLRDRGRTCSIVGVKSFGKGIAYDETEIASGTLSITFARTQAPSGTDWHGIGITPSLVVENPRETSEDLQLRAAIAELASGKCQR